jgi:hypothetical protein
VQRDLREGHYIGSRITRIVGGNVADVDDSAACVAIVLLQRTYWQLREHGGSVTYSAIYHDHESVCLEAVPVPTAAHTNAHNFLHCAQVNGPPSLLRKTVGVVSKSDA